jgi:hypothetical protein
MTPRKPTFLGPIIPYAPCPYRFKYDCETRDGKRTGTCQDWETEAKFFNWRQQYSVNGFFRRLSPPRGFTFVVEGFEPNE